MPQLCFVTSLHPKALQTASNCFAHLHLADLKISFDPRGCQFQDFPDLRNSIVPIGEDHNCVQRFLRWRIVPGFAQKTKNLLSFFHFRIVWLCASTRIFTSSKVTRDWFAQTWERRKNLVRHLESRTSGGSPPSLTRCYDHALFGSGPEDEKVLYEEHLPHSTDSELLLLWLWRPEKNFAKRVYICFKLKEYF